MKDLSDFAKELNPVALDCGASLLKDTKYLIGYRLSNKMPIYIQTRGNDTKNLLLMLDPELGFETIKNLPGIAPEDVDPEEKFHSNMTGFPMKKHNGKTEITYAIRATVRGLDNLKKVLLALSEIKR